MCEDATKIAYSNRKSVTVQAFGDTVAEIEASALEEGRAFFGEGRTIQIDPEYNAWRYLVLDDKPMNKKYQAYLNVYLVSPEPNPG